MTEPYYSDDAVMLYHGDCLELAEAWTGADVLVTDPPYGIDGHLSAGYKGRRPAAGHQRTNDKPQWDTTLAARDAAIEKWGGASPLCSVRLPGAARRCAPLPRVSARVGQGGGRHG